MKYVDHENWMAVESAIQKLRPGAGFSIRSAGNNADDEIQIGFDEGVMPLSPEEISAEVSAAAALKAANAYRQKRRDAYPDIGDQLDALFHAGVFPEDMAAKLQAVKDANPK
tara:strand:- start:3718 stop:4053 length:336 start_codon:yes stop_codon:yes gene_type:complete